MLYRPIGLAVKRSIMRLKFIVGLLCLVLIVSVGANFALFHLSNTYYREANGTRLDPLGLWQYPEVPSSNVSDDSIRVALLGDSRIEMWTPPDIEGFELINRGISGQTSAQIRGRFSEPVVPLEPDVVVLQLGVNDLKTIPLFPYWDEDILSRTKENIAWLVSESETLGADVILTTIISRGPIPLQRRFVWTDEVDVAIQDVNEFIFSLEQDSVTIMDAERLLSGDDHIIDKQFRVDMLHVNEDAYARLSRELEKILGDGGK